MQILKEQQQLEEAHQLQVDQLRAKEEQVAAVARKAMDEVNKMTRAKLNELQNSIDRQQAEHVEALHALAISAKDAAEEAKRLTETRRLLEEDLQDALEREDELQEEYVKDLTTAKQKIEQLEEVQARAMEKMKEQYDLIEEEVNRSLGTRRRNERRT